MADVKTEMSPDEWRELLDPYGWTEIVVRAPAVLFRVPPGLLEYEIRLILKGDDGERDEWVQRSNLLDQARRAVKAVQAKGFTLWNAPRIEFGGDYRYRIDQGAVPDWVAQAELSFSAHPI